MSRLATIVGALSAIVSLVDYLVARSFLSHWVQRQIKHGDDGWQISPTLNLIFIAALTGLVWLVTESSAGEPEARKRLFRLRANLVIGALAAWFVFGPSIGNIEVIDPSPPGMAQLHASAAQPAGQPTGATIGQAGNLPPAGPPSHGHTSQFTWNRAAGQPSGGTWKPGDGLRAMARLLEESSVPARTPAR